MKRMLAQDDWPDWAEGYIALAEVDPSPSAERAERSHLGVWPLTFNRARLGLVGPTGCDAEHW